MTADVPVREATMDDVDELVALWAHYIRVHRTNPAYRLAGTTDSSTDGSGSSST